MRSTRPASSSPGTPLAVVEPLLDELVLVLAVNPAWSGQSFIPSTERRVADVQRLSRVGRSWLPDGGITKANVEHVASLGVDLIVKGSAVCDD